MRAVTVATSASLAALTLSTVLLWPHASSPAPAPAAVGTSASPQAQASASTSAPEAGLSAQDTATLSTELASDQAEQVRRAVLLPAGQALPAELPGQLASLGTLTFDRTTFAADSDATATITATSTPPGRTSARWTVHLVHDTAAGWLLAATERQ